MKWAGIGKKHKIQILARASNFKYVLDNIKMQWLMAYDDEKLHINGFVLCCSFADGRQRCTIVEYLEILFMTHSKGQIIANTRSYLKAIVKCLNKGSFYLYVFSQMSSANVITKDSGALSLSV